MQQPCFLPRYSCCKLEHSHVQGSLFSLYVICLNKQIKSLFLSVTQKFLFLFLLIHKFLSGTLSHANIIKADHNNILDYIFTDSHTCQDMVLAQHVSPFLVQQHFLTFQIIFLPLGLFPAQNLTLNMNSWLLFYIAEVTL